MDMLDTAKYPTFLAELDRLGKNNTARAKQIGTKHAKTVERLGRRFPIQYRALLEQPQLLRALLTDLEARAA